MALNLSTLTDPSTSAGILTDLAKSASNLDLVASLENQVSGGANATQTTATRQPRAHVPVGDGHLYLSGVSGNYASVPNETALNILGDIELQWFGEHTSGVQETLIAKWGTGSNNYILRTKTNDRLQFYRTSQYVESTAAPSSDAVGFKVTHRVSDDRVQFFETTDGNSWSQVGADKTIPAQTPSSGTSIVEVGSLGGGTQNPLSGLVNRVIIKDGIDGSSALDIDFSDGDHKASSFACSTGQTVTINTSGNDPATIVRRNFLRFDGASDSLVGVFNSTNTTGGYMFASFSVNGDGGTTSGRIFNMKSDDYHAAYNSNKSFIWSVRNSDTNNLAYYYNHNFRGIHTGKFDEANGVILHEVKAVDGTQFSKVNNADIKSTALTLTTLSSEDFYIAQNPSGTGTPAIDLEALYLFDHTLTDDDATKVRDYLNAKSSIY
ncbi:hypothetical protein OAL22_00645 [bacterium]|nr:hypothetical protein [bacterium]